MSSTNPVSSSTSSSATSQGGVSSLGLGSGLDLNGIISKLIAIEQQPVTALQAKKTTSEAKISVLSTLQNDLTTLQTSIFALKNAGSSNNFSATSSNSAYVSASADSTATPATYTVNVTTLAQAQSIAAVGQASSTAAIGGGAATTMTINFGTISGVLVGGIYNPGATFTANASQSAITVTLDSTNNTLEGIRDAINNSTDNDGRVTASIVNDGSGTPYRLSITSSSGVDNSLSIGIVGDAALDTLLAYDPTATQNMTEQQTAQSASFTINGLAITSSSNTVTTAATGVTFNLLTAASSATITVAPDNSDITTALTDFVEAYNTVATEITTNTAYEALLQGNAGLRILSSQLTAAIFELQSSSSSGYNSLTDLGVTFKADNSGTLSLDEDILAAALADDPDQVKTVVGGAGVALGEVIFSALGVSGLVSGEITALYNQVTDIDEQITKLNERITTSEANLRKRFSTLDALIATMQRTGSFLTEQFASMAANSNGGSK